MRPARWLLALALFSCAQNPETPSTLAQTPPAAPTTAEPSAPPLGTRLNLAALRWITPPPTGAKVLLLRWWTDGCPYCEATLPAIDALRARYEAQGLVTVGVYHPKPKTKQMSPAAITEAAKARGFAGGLAVDDGWATLEQAWLRTGERAATSVTLVVDAGGVVRFVHPGPEFFDGPPESPPARDYRAVEEAIRALLRE